MSEYDGTILYKNWLPDQPDLNNPGLTQAQNCLPISGQYGSYAPLSAVTSGTTAGGSSTTPATNALRAGPYIYLATNILFRDGGSGDGVFTTIGAVGASTPEWALAQYEQLVLAVGLNEWLQYHTIGSGSTMLEVTDGPKAQAIGIVGQFVVLGETSSTPSTFGGGQTYQIRWSGIDAPLSYPTPGSATAIAQQSGVQNLPPNFGSVVGIFGNDQRGILIQEGGVSRMIYVGGSAVFQFDTIDQGSGCKYRNAMAKVGDLVYYPSHRGFVVTDGVSVQPIGVGMVDEYFRTRVTTTEPRRVVAGVDYARKLIFWSYPGIADGDDASQALVYNYEEKRWGFVVDTIRCFVRGSEFSTSEAPTGPTVFFQAIGTNNRLGNFSGTPGTALLASAEMELNRGGFGRFSGIKPLVDATVNAVTVALGTRNNRTDAVSYTSETTANSRSGFANFRSEARYHRARLSIVGTFNAAQGIEYQAAPSGYT